MTTPDNPENVTGHFNANPFQTKAEQDDLLRRIRVDGKAEAKYATFKMRTFANGTHDFVQQGYGGMGSTITAELNEKTQNHMRTLINDGRIVISPFASMDFSSPQTDFRDIHHYDDAIWAIKTSPNGEKTIGLMEYTGDTIINNRVELSFHPFTENNPAIERLAKELEYQVAQIQTHNAIHLPDGSKIERVIVDTPALSWDRTQQAYAAKTENPKPADFNGLQFDNIP